MGASDYAPFSFRKAAYLDIGGIDEGMGEPGQCGILSDWEISSRMWLAGWQLGYSYIFMKLDGGTGGGLGRLQRVSIIALLSTAYGGMCTNSALDE